MRAALAAALLATALPSAAWANQVTDELTLASTRPTGQNPRSGSISDALSARWDLTDRVDVTGRLSGTRDASTPAQSGAAFGDTGGTIFLLSLGGDWEATAHLTLGATADFSPRSNQNSDSPLTASTAAGEVQVDALLHTRASSAGGNLSLTYDTADLDAEEASKLDFAMGLDLGFTRLSSEQDITQVATAKDRTLSVRALDGYCAAHPKAAVCKVVAGLSGQTTAVTQFPLAASATATILEDTDVGLAFTWYAYSQDPNDAGFFTVASAGRTARPGGSVDFGAGLPLAPQQYSLRPDVGHAFGPVYVDAFLEYGNYLDDAGHEGALGLKVKWKLSKSFKLTASATFSKDTPGPAASSDGTAADSQPVSSSAFTAGLRYTF